MHNDHQHLGEDNKGWRSAHSSHCCVVSLCWWPMCCSNDPLFTCQLSGYKVMSYNQQHNCVYLVQSDVKYQEIQMTHWLCHGQRHRDLMNIQNYPHLPLTSSLLCPRPPIPFSFIGHAMACSSSLSLSCHYLVFVTLGTRLLVIASYHCDLISSLNSESKFSRLE